MQKNGHTTLAENLLSIVICKPKDALAVQAEALKLNRNRVVFEVHEPDWMVRVSEVFEKFEIQLNDRLAYTGRAVVTSVVDGGTFCTVEAKLDNDWLDVQPTLPGEQRHLAADFDGLIKHWQKNYRIEAKFKIAVADLQTFLSDLKIWIDQAQLSVNSHPEAERAELERNFINELQAPVLPMLGRLFEVFEDSCAGIEPELRATHRHYFQRQLHPLLLAAPFMYRTFKKPLGYAGDYGMVRMMMEDPQQGNSMFAKLVNTFFLMTPPVVAHRNRIEYLKTVLTNEVARAMRYNRRAKVFNLGCGPAQELQDFITNSPLSEAADFTLLDFNDETLQFTGKTLRQLVRQHGRRTTVEMVEKSVMQVIRDSARGSNTLFASNYDLVYCAGLFDYIPDNVCQKLMTVFYKMLAPGGLLVATNVDSANPSRNSMEYSMDWHLIYRSGHDMKKLIPPPATADDTRIMSEPSGVNTFIEVRRPQHG